MRQTSAGVIKLLFELHEGLSRAGPGSDEATRRAFRMIPRLSRSPVILDIGCGPGAQTLELARLSGGRVIGLDIHLPFLAHLMSRRREEALSGRISLIQGSMSALGFKPGVFDIIWSEGAIYIHGFDEGLRTWRSFLKEGGVCAVSELSWLTKDPPSEPSTFFSDVYPGMRTVSENLAACRKYGYNIIGHFALPDDAWEKNYYRPLARRLKTFGSKHPDDPDALALISATRREIALFRKYSTAYGYVFYVLRKRGRQPFTRF